MVLSAHGRTGLARVLLGGTAEKVVRPQEHEFVAPVSLEGQARPGAAP